MLLPEPYEFVDLNHLTSETYIVTGWQDGSVVIHPRNPTPRHVRIMMDQRNLTAPPVPGEPISVEVPALRLLIEPQPGLSAPNYRDVSSKTLRADLLARLTSGLVLPATLKLTANGHAPRKRYSVEVLS